MFNPDRIRRDLEFGKQYDQHKKGTGDFGFPWLRPKDLPDGTFPFRLMPPHPSLNPEGYVLINTHTIQTVRGGSYETKLQVLAPDAVDDPTTASNYIMQVLGGIDQLELWEKVSPELRAAIDDLIPWKRFWFPVAMNVNCTETKVEGKKQPKRTYVENKGAKPLGRIFEIGAPKLLERLAELIGQYPTLAHFEMGRKLVFKKVGTQYSLDVDDPTPIDPEAKKLIDGNGYPKLLELRKKFYFKSHPEIVAAVGDSWWKPYLDKLGIDFSDDEEEAPF